MITFKEFNKLNEKNRTIDILNVNNIEYIKMDIREANGITQTCLVFELKDGMVYSEYKYGNFGHIKRFKNKDIDDIINLKEEYEKRMNYVNKIIEEHKLRLLFRKGDIDEKDK